MALIINLETSTQTCSVALVSDGSILGLRESHEDKSHAGRLTLFIEDLLQTSSLKATDLDAIAVSRGPGSYTGLRIGVSTAKGLAYALDRPLIGVDTLAALTTGALERKEVYELTVEHGNVLFCPMIDARRMEVYTATFDPEGREVEPVNAKIIDGNSYSGLLEKHTLVFFGNGSGKCRKEISHPDAVFIEEITCSAAFMAFHSEKSFRQEIFENVAYFEPSYLKDFIATIPRKKVL